MGDRCVRFIKFTQARKVFSPQRQTRTREHGNIPHRLREIKIIHRVCIPLVKRSADKPAHSHDQPGVLNFSVPVNHFRRYRSHLWVFQRFNQILYPIPLPALHVVIKKNEAFTAGGTRASIAFRGKIERLIESNEVHICPNRQFF